MGVGGRKSQNNGPVTRALYFSCALVLCFAQNTAFRLKRLKKDDATEVRNYRPISLLSIRSKILESEVNDSLLHHVFKEHGLASDRQWAYWQRY